MKYLLFVNTIERKLKWWRTACRRNCRTFIPACPRFRVFDAGVGDGSVLCVRVMRAMHDRYPTTLFYVVGKEISLERRPSDDVEALADQLLRTSRDLSSC